MSVRLSSSIGSSRFGAWLVVGLLGCVVSGQGQSPNRRPIEFSEPKSTQVLSNLNQLANKNEGRAQLEEDLSQSRQRLDRSSLDGIPAPAVFRPGNPAIQDPRVRELLDKKKNWIFLSPEDLAKGPTAESIFNVPEFDADGKEKKKGSVLETFFERQKSDKSNRGPSRDTQTDEARDRTDSSDDSRLADDANLPVGLRQIQRELKRELSTSEKSRPIVDLSSQSSSLSELFEFSDQGTLHNPNDPTKELNPLYHPMLGGANAPGINSLAPFDPVAAAKDSPSAAPVGSIMDSMTSTGSKSIIPTVNTAGPALSIPQEVDVNTKALTWNPMTPSVPQVEQRRVAPPTSIPDFPRRQF